MRNHGANRNAQAPAYRWGRRRKLGDKRSTAIAVFVVLVTVASCASGDTTGAKRDQSTVLSAEEVAERTDFSLDKVGGLLPSLALVDGYLNQDAGHAQLLLQVECLIENGDLTAEEYLRAPRTVHYPTRDVRTTEAVFTADIARTYGYTHPDAPEDAILKALPEPTLSVEERGACGDAAATELAAPENELQFVNDVRMAGWKAIYTGERYVTSKLLALAKEWKACLTPLGIPDLPDDPFSMPPESVVPRGDDPTKRTPSARELIVASKDYECRDSVGLNEAEWRGRAVAELEAIGRSWERWESALPEIAEYLRRCQDVIARLGTA